VNAAQFVLQIASPACERDAIGRLNVHGQSPYGESRAAGRSDRGCGRFQAIQRNFGNLLEAFVPKHAQRVIE